MKTYERCVRIVLIITVVAVGVAQLDKSTLKPATVIPFW